jgi:hypothetical protein
VGGWGVVLHFLKRALAKKEVAPIIARCMVPNCFGGVNTFLEGKDIQKKFLFCTSF